MEEESAAWTEEERMCNEQQCFGYMSEIGLLFYEVNSSSVLFIHEYTWSMLLKWITHLFCKSWMSMLEIICVF